VRAMSTSRVELDNLTPEVEQALQKIAELVLPSDLKLDVWKYARHGGYDKKLAVEDFLEGCRKQPLVTMLKLFCVYTELLRLYDKEMFRDGGRT